MEIKYWISTTIKKTYMDKILDGTKKYEYKGASEYWIKRISKFMDFTMGELGINFLCGQKSYKFIVADITKWSGTMPRDIDGTEYKSYYQIQLGDQILHKCKTKGAS